MLDLIVWLLLPKMNQNLNFQIYVIYLVPWVNACGEQCQTASLQQGPDDKGPYIHPHKPSGQ